MKDLYVRIADLIIRGKSMEDEEVARQTETMRAVRGFEAMSQDLNLNITDFTLEAYNVINFQPVVESVAEALRESSKIDTNKGLKFLELLQDDGVQELLTMINSPEIVKSMYRGNKCNTRAVADLFMRLFGDDLNNKMD